MVWSPNCERSRRAALAETLRTTSQGGEVGEAGEADSQLISRFAHLFRAGRVEADEAFDDRKEGPR